MPADSTLTTHETSPYWSIEGLADHWGCSTDSVRRMIKRGELKAVRVGRLIRIHRQDAKNAMRPVTGGEAA